jgi:ubiquinone/menaquinone biosynthesis C-methylase UbiE
MMYDKTAHYYDHIYLAQGKDYRQEAARVHAIIQKYKQTPGNMLLDVACGTGGHLGYLNEHYTVEGLDLDDKMLAITSEKHPDIPLHQSDMVDFYLGWQFDAVVCLFSSIGYVLTIERLNQTLETFARHIHPGGVVLVEPWLFPEKYKPGSVHAAYVNEPQLKIARMSISKVEDGVSVHDFHYLIATPEGVHHEVERHELRLFTHEEYMNAFHQARLTVHFDNDGITGRGLYIGRKDFG